MDYWNFPVLVDEQVCENTGEIQTVEISMHQNSYVIFGSVDIDRGIARYGAEIFFTHPVLSIITGIVCIDETYANSLLAV